MSYGEKYRISFSVQEGSIKQLVTYVIRLKKLNYDGPIELIERTGGDNVVMKYNNVSDSLTGIQDKTISIDLLENFSLEELLIVEPRQFICEIWRGNDENATLDFRGFLQASKQSRDYKDGFLNYRIEAVCGLTLLKSVNFVDETGWYYEGLRSIFEIARICLNKLDLQLDINTINNFFQVGDSSSGEDEPLKQRYIDAELYRGDNEPKTAYQVLSGVLETEKMRLFQEDGAWWIEYVPEKFTGFIKSRKYDFTGLQKNYGTLNLGVSATHGSSFQPLSSGTITYLQPVRKTTITHKLAAFKNRILNKDFKFYNDTSHVFANWGNQNVVPVQVGDGTSGNPFGAKISGFATKIKNAGYIYQNITLGAGETAYTALQRNIVFSGQAYTECVEDAVVRCLLLIATYDNGTFLFGLSDSGDWVRQGENIVLKNVDVNNHAKKTPVSWNITSKRIGDVKLINNVGTTFSFEGNLASVSIQIVLSQGVGELDAYAGETQSSSVTYKNISLSWVNANTNLNLKEISYRASQDSYATLETSISADYGDYVDPSNLSALLNSSGNTTGMWTSALNNVPANFHRLGAEEMLKNTALTQKVYDGTIWGKLKYRHILAMAGFVNKLYITSYTYNYASSTTNIRAVEFQIPAISVQHKKIGVLTDGTEINLSGGDSLPSPIIGNSSGGGLLNFTGGLFSWIRQIIGGGVKALNDNEDEVALVWNNANADDTHDFGSLVRDASGVLLLGKDDVSIGVGSDTSTTEVKGNFKLRNTSNFTGDFLIAENTDNRSYTFPDEDIIINEWADISNKPASFKPDTSYFRTEYGLIGLLNGTNKVFQTSENFVAGSTRVYLNGVRQYRGTSIDYTETGANEITFSVAPDTTDLIIIDYIKQ